MGEFNLLTDGRQANRIAQLRRALDGNPIHSGDHIAFDEAGPGSRRAWLDAADHGTLARARAQCLGEIGRQILDCDPDPPAPHLTVLR